MTIGAVGTYGFDMYYGRNSLESKEVTQKQYLSFWRDDSQYYIKLLFRVCFYPYE